MAQITRKKQCHKGMLHLVASSKITGSASAGKFKCATNLESPSLLEKLDSAHTRFPLCITEVLQ
jgi:hypothetical protein